MITARPVSKVENNPVQEYKKRQYRHKKTEKSLPIPATLREFRAFSRARVHLGAPLSTISPVFSLKGPSERTLKHDFGLFLAQGSI
jgi:hypothetical protein